MQHQNLDTLEAHIEQMLPDNTQNKIEPVHVRSAIGSAIDTFIGFMAYMVPEEVTKSVTLPLGTERSFQIILANASNTLGKWMGTSLSHRFIFEGEHYTTQRAGTVVTVTITAEKFDVLKPGEKILYTEFQKGANVQFRIPEIQVINFQNLPYFAWKFPGDPNEAFLPIQQLVVPNGYNTTQITHNDRLGQRYLADVLGPLSLRMQEITPATDWRTLTAGMYFYTSTGSPWLESNKAPSGMYGWGMVRVTSLGGGSGIMEVFPHRIENNIVGAYCYRHPGSSWDSSPWKYLYDAKATQNKFQKLTAGPATADTGADVQLFGVVEIGGIDQTVKVGYNSTIAYTRNTWIAIPGLPTQAGTYAIQINLATGYANVKGALYSFSAGGIISIGPQNSFTDAGEFITVLLSQYAQIFGPTSVDFRWALKRNVVPELQFRINNDNQDAGGNIPLKFQYRRIL